MLRKLIALFLAAPIIAVATPVDTSIMVPLDSGMSLASGVQWNADYLVTVKHHVDPRSAWSSPSHDIRFIKRTGTAPAWRAHVVGEAVTAVGTGIGVTRVNTGVVMPSTLLGLQVATYASQAGMSGGPVIANDNHVVGITAIGRWTRDGKRDSGFVPFKDIEAAWYQFQEVLAAELKAGPALEKQAGVFRITRPIVGN